MERRMKDVLRGRLVLPLQLAWTIVIEPTRLLVAEAGTTVSHTRQLPD